MLCLAKNNGKLPKQTNQTLAISQKKKKKDLRSYRIVIIMFAQVADCVVLTHLKHLHQK